MEAFEVKLATPENMKDILHLLELMHDEVHLFPLDPEEGILYIDKLMNKNGGIIGCIQEDGVVNSIIGLVLERYWYSKQWFLYEMFTFVHPDLRKSTRAKSLLQFAKNCAEEMNLPLVTGITSNHRTEAKIKLYERQFDRMGSFFIHNKEAIGAY